MQQLGIAVATEIVSKAMATMVAQRPIVSARWETLAAATSLSSVRGLLRGHLTSSSPRRLEVNSIVSLLAHRAGNPPTSSSLAEE